VSDWVVYILRCSDGSLYTGITTNIQRRLEAHRNGKGAKYFRGRQPVEILYTEPCANRSAASSREAQIKRMPRREKLELVSRNRAANPAPNSNQSQL
jgi:putative endonuclease